MLLGVVSDTHNNSKNIETVVGLFNSERVDCVIHTGDITNAKSLEKFSSLNCDLYGVYGNNDRNEPGLKEVAIKYKFNLQEPPLKMCIGDKNIAIFHEPDLIEDFLKINLDIDLVVHGHTHRYREDTQKNILFFNPGESAGMQEGKNAVGIIDLKTLSAKRIFF